MAKIKNHRLVKGCATQLTLAILPALLLSLLLSVLVLPSSGAFATGEAGVLTGSSLNGDTVQAEQIQTDPYGRDTPSGTVKGMLKALANADDELLQQFFETPSKDPKATLTELQLLLDRRATIATDIELNKTPAGNLSDELDNNLDRIGTIKIASENKDLLLKRVGENENKIWVLPASFTKQISTYLEQTKPTVLDGILSEPLKKLTLFNLSVGHILATIVVGIAVFVAGLVFGFLVIFLFSKLWPRLRGRTILFDKVLVVPLAFVFASEVFQFALSAIGVSINVREPANNFAQIFGWIAIAWLLMRLIESISRRAEELSLRDGHTGSLSAISLLKRVAKALVVIAAVLFILGNLGVDLTTGIAALGIGGLALALGAQKTVENFVGSVVVVADRPINVGDYCRFGATEGTVEDIGIRSTRIRTLERTLVTIPNGDFSSMEIENFSARDRHLFCHTFAFALNTKRAQLEKVLFDMRMLLNETNYVGSDFRVRLRYAERDCYKIEVFAYILTRQFAEFLEQQENLLLDMIGLIEMQEVDLVPPTQQMQVS